MAKWKVPKMPLIRPTGRPIQERAKAATDAARHHLEPEEVTALWGFLKGDPFWHGYFRLQYHFGCRCSEVAILLKEDVDLVGKQIIIRRLKKRFEKTNGDGFVQRSYDIPDGLLPHLTRVQAVVPKDNPWFFGSPHRARGKERAERMANIRITDGGWRSVSRSSAQLHFAGAAEAVGIPVHLRHTHVLRHTRATLLFARGVPESQVQFLLDHSSPSITKRYLGWADMLKKRASLSALLEDE
jgi:integrase